MPVLPAAPSNHHLCRWESHDAGYYSGSGSSVPGIRRYEDVPS